MLGTNYAKVLQKELSLVNILLIPLETCRLFNICAFYQV
uniref:Uncharacterized protein n=1 Tax=Anguilla anguilla TaxID=7936 RepID=A0A0E9WQE5_ANGAN